MQDERKPHVSTKGVNYSKTGNKGILGIARSPPLELSPKTLPTEKEIAISFYRA